jgi:hypothetical protein
MKRPFLIGDPDHGELLLWLSNDVWPYVQHIEADNERLRNLLVRVWSSCKTDLHIRGILSQLGEDIREEIEEKL